MQLGTRRIVDRTPVYVPWHRHIKILLVGCTHEVIGKGKTHVGKMDAILTDSHLDTRNKICILLNVIVPKLYRMCRRSVGREREARKTAGNSADVSS